MSPGPLDGLRVVDFSHALAGPLASMLMGDMGADVVKVERPGTGDQTRTWGPPFADGLSTYFLAVNRNKRGVALDLSDSTDRAAAEELCRDADVVMENFRTGTMERHGLGYDAVADANPGVVWCSITAFGAGSGAELPGYDLLVQAAGGLVSVTGERDGPPTRTGVALVDVLAGLYAAIGVLGALRARDRDGRGQRVSVSLLSALLTSLVNHSQGYVSTGQVPGRVGRRHPSISPYGLFAAADGPVVIAAGTDRQFQALAAVLGLPGEVVAGRYATNADRVGRADELEQELEARLARRPGSEWVQELTRAGVPAGPVNDMAQALALAARLGLEPTVELAREDGEPVAQVANPIGLSRTPVRYDLPPPRLGEHTEQVLAQAGAGPEPRSPRGP